VPPLSFTGQGIVLPFGGIILSGLLNSNSEQMRIRIDYDGPWSITYGDSSGSFSSFSGTGSEVIILDRPEGLDHWTIVANVMKTDSSNHTLWVIIETMDGIILGNASTDIAFFPAQCVAEID